MRFWICQDCRRLFWSAGKTCDRCGRELILYNNAEGEYFVKTLGFSQVGVPEVSALEESLDTLFGRQMEKDRQAEKDAREALKKSPVKKEEKKAPEAADHYSKKVPSETSSQQQKEREEQRRKTEEKRRQLLQNSTTRKAPAPDEIKEEKERGFSVRTVKSRPQEEQRSVNVREKLSKLGLRKKGISVE